MKRILEKILYVYKPVLLSSIGLLIIYSCINILLRLKFNIIDLNEKYVDFFFPFILSGLAVYLFLHPKIRRFKFGERAKNFFYFISVLLIVAPIVVFQKFLTIELGELKKTSNPFEIDKNKLYKFYEITDYYIDLRNFDYLNKKSSHRSEYNLTSYFVAPMKTKQNDRSTSVWFCVKYNENVSNRLIDDKAEQMQKIESIYKKNQALFIHNKDYNKINYFSRINNSDDYNYFSEIVMNNSHNKDIILLQPEYENFSDRSTTLFTWSIALIVLSNFTLFFIMISAPYSIKKNNRLFVFDFIKIKEILNTFIPRKGFFFTPLCIDVNLLVFLVMIVNHVDAIEPTTLDMITWGGNARQLVLGGDYWRLLTSIFIHAGLLHLFMNLFSLWFVGIFLESSVGSRKISIVYFFSGIIASLSSFLFNDFSVSVGASGAIFGLYGFFLARILTKTIDKVISQVFFSTILIFVGYNLVMGLSGNIDNAAHIGGLITGFLVGIVDGLIVQGRIDYKDNFN